MPNAVYYVSYKLKKGATEALIKGHISKQAGYVSFRLLAEGDTWADSVTFETMDNLNAFMEAAHSSKNELAEKFYLFLNFSTCKSTVYTVEMSL
jgi:hypothetical protein